MKFVDEVSVYARSGKGGDGCIAFLREKFRPFGGPSGGDGGRGGSVVFFAEPQLSTLLDLRYAQHQWAEDGEGGKGNQKYGKGAEDLRVPVPVGTLVSDAETGELLGDLLVAGQEVVAARGGRGGRGNMHFATPSSQAPRYSEEGGARQERQIRLTLKLLADVALVGFPNAGKSTLISRLSRARPKIADYPFTTLVPNLGIVRTSPDKTFVVADVPGLIGGASDGAGLGHRFLRHVERVHALAILLDVSPDPARHPVTDYQTLLTELGAYSKKLLEKPRVIVLTKADLPDTEAALEEVEALAKQDGLPFFLISSVRGDRLDDLCYCLQDLVDKRRRLSSETTAAPASEADLDEPSSPDFESAGNQ